MIDNKKIMNNLGNIKIVEDVNYEDYNNEKIEDFGRNMLYKMGWKDNQPLRKNGPIEPIQFKIRNAGLGLGAEPLEDEKKSITLKKNFYGTKIKIVSGKHKGLKGKLVDKDIQDLQVHLNENKYINVELKLNKKIVKIESEYIKIRSKKKKNSKKSKSVSKSNSSDQQLESDLQKKKNASLLKWVLPNIIVRIISKNSKYYNCKGLIEDLLDKHTFSLLMLDDKTIHTEFSEEDIETYIPKLENNVIILSGKFRGETAKLILRDKNKNIVTVQLLSDFSLIELTQDDVSAILK